MPQTIVEARSYSKPRKCDVPADFATLGKGDSPTGNDSSLVSLFPNGQSSENSPYGERETVEDKGISSLSVLTNNEINCKLGNDLGSHSPNLLSGARSSCGGENGGVIKNSEDKVRNSGFWEDSLPNKPLKSNNMRIVKETESEILGDFSDLLSSISSPNKLSNGFSSESVPHLEAFESPKSNGSDLGFWRSNSKNSSSSLKCGSSNSPNNENLSDILSTISFEDNNSMRKGLKSSDSNLCFKDIRGKRRQYSEFPTVNFNCPATNDIKLNGYELQDNNNLSDMLMSNFIEESSLNSSSIPSNVDKFNEVIKVSNWNSLAPKSNTNCRDGFFKRNGYKSQNSETSSDMFISNFIESCEPMQNGFNSSSMSSRGDLSSEKIKEPNCNRLVPELPKSITNWGDVDFFTQNRNESRNNEKSSDMLMSNFIEACEPMQRDIWLPSSGVDLFNEKIQVPSCNGVNLKLSKPDSNCTAEGLKVNNYVSQNKGTLSYNIKPLPKTEPPFFTAPRPNICREDIQVPYSNGFDDFCSKINSNCRGGNFERTNNDTFPDIMSISSLNGNLNSNSGIFNGPIVTKGNSTSDTHDELLASFVDSVDECRPPTSSISVPMPKPPVHNQKNEFSFFSVSPENMFSDMVSKLKKDVNSEDNSPNNNSGDISMLDLFKSVNSDSSSPLSDYLSSEGSLTDNNATEAAHGLSEVMDIDLSSCIKTRDDTLKKISPEKRVIEDCIDTHANNRNELQLDGFMIKAFSKTDCLKRPRMKLKQGLFAKSLACKPKKNPLGLQKVAKIRSELFEKYFNRPFFKVEAIKGVGGIKDLIVSRSNNCMITFNGRRVCTSNGVVDFKSE